MYYDDESWGSLILKAIGVIFLVVIITSSSRSCSRDDRNMVLIKEGYCYDRDTRIIYIESYTGRYRDDTAYTPYYDANGSLCKYDVYTGEWLPIERTSAIK